MKIHPPNQRFTRLYRQFLYRLAGGFILLLTTKGRRSGREHTVGLQYELIDGKYWVGSANGERSDWYRNAQACPQVEIQTGAGCFSAVAEFIENTQQAADFLAFRLARRPLMIRLILWIDGVRGKITGEKLLAYARRIRVVVFIPIK